MKLTRFFVVLPILCAVAHAQDRFPTMPRYDRYEKLGRQIFGSVKGGSLNVSWAADGKELSYSRDGKDYRFDIAKLSESEGAGFGGEQQANRGRRRAGGGGPDRGRQFSSITSNDGKLKVSFRDRNLYLSNADGSNEVAITTDGSAEKRTKYGQASWVYGEELGVREAMWFSPDDKKVAYYFFDESKVPDYWIAMEQTKIQDKPDIEAYPKAGAPNPEVELYVYDIATKKSTKIDDKFGDAALGHYIYSVRWSPTGKELLFNRTNRHQNTMQFCAADPQTGKCRVVVEEKSNTWTDNSPQIEWLENKNNFLWFSERNGYRNIYLGSLEAGGLKPITQNQFEVANIVRVDEKTGVLYYMARDGENPYKLQLHRVGMDGSGDKRLTDPEFNHTVNVSPTGHNFVDVYEKMDAPPATQLCDDSGKVLAQLAKSDTSQFDQLHLQKSERIKFKAADGKTDLYGYIMKPSDFDPAKKYPLLVSLYAGPESGSGTERFTLPQAITEMGFIVAWFDGRGTSGRGKAFKDEVYKKLGIVEIDDQAAGVKYLRERPYIDGSRVGIYGTSYGGYASLMSLLRYPDVFHVSVSCSPVTAWYNYDSIYTERYMSLPDENDNKSGYEAGSAMNYAKDLKGRLLLFYGTADNNVHPSNTMQLAQALQRAGKSFDMMVGPDMGHSAINQARQWEYFVDYLILDNDKHGIDKVWNRRLRQRAAARR